MSNTTTAAKSSATTLPHAALNWRAVLANAQHPLVLTNNAAKAAQLCALGQPAIAVFGISADDLTTWLRAKGARVVTKGRTN